MNQMMRIGVLAVVVFVLSSAPAMAQQEDTRRPAVGTIAVNLSGAFGAGITLLGAGWGIGRVGAAAVENMARQPEVAGQIQTAMIIAAALIEGATFFALIVCIIHGAPWPAL